MTPADLNLLSAFAKSVHSAKLTGPQLAMLIAIAEHPGSHINQISEATSIKYSSGSYYPLEERGLIEITTKITPYIPLRTGPRKVNHLSITKAGKDLLRVMAESI